ncbi:MAG: hypothetical protein JWM91_5403 [Rhodospirillales bacterium]|nr:hypothetical protein [Rhodospirillales bacterium]
MEVRKRGQMSSVDPGLVSDRSTPFAALRFASTYIAVLGGIALILVLELVATLVATGGHLAYVIEAPYVHLTLASQIALGHYGLVAGESAAPSSTILYPFLLAALAPLRLGTALPLVINNTAALLAGMFAVLLADECGLPLRRIAPARIFALTVAVALALNLAGLAFTGLEHSLHVAASVVYILGLARFIRRGRCDWWWFLCIIVQPLIRFEGAGLLLADGLIFVCYRRYDYALAVVMIGLALVGGYSLFLHALGLPLLPSSVLSRSDWSNAAVSGHSSVLTVLISVFRNLYQNLNSFGAVEILGGVALTWVWASAKLMGPDSTAFNKEDQVKLILAFFLSFVSVAQLVGGKIASVPPRYEAYVLALNLCGIAVIYRDTVSAWCERATWSRVGVFATALVLVFAGYASQTFAVPALARKEYLGPFQLHRFVTDFYHSPVATDQLGYVNYDNPYYVLDLSGLSSEAVRRARADQHSVDWMDTLLAHRHIGLAIIDSDNVPTVPERWSEIAELKTPGGNGPTANHILFYAARPEDTAKITEALDRFAPTLPHGDRLVWRGSHP